MLPTEFAILLYLVHLFEVKPTQGLALLFPMLQSVLNKVSLVLDIMAVGFDTLVGKAEVMENLVIIGKRFTSHMLALPPFDLCARLTTSVGLACSHEGAPRMKTRGRDFESE